MISGGTQPLTTGDLTISHDSGEVRNSHGITVRLGPVNMAILNLLVSRAGDVVSRKELFDSVWKHQTVNDDVLTRCISDIRAALSEFSDGHQFIQTLPKRGYRWNPNSPRAERPVDDIASEQKQLQRSEVRPGIAAFFRSGLLYLAAFVAIASFGVLLVDKLAGPTESVVVVMPTESDPAHKALAAKLEEELTEHFLGFDQISLLSRSAVQSGPTNPFPYFYHEFGARWLVESKLRVEGDEHVLSIALVDARAGIVLMQLSERIAPHDGDHGIDPMQVLEPLRDYVYAQRER